MNSWIYPPGPECSALFDNTLSWSHSHHDVRTSKSTWIPHTMPENLWRTQTTLSATFSHIQLNCCPFWITLPYYHYFRAVILPLKQHITAGGPLFSVLLSWKLLLILTFQCFLYVLPNIFESTARPFEPLWKMLAMPLRLLGSWFEILQWHTNWGKNEGKKGAMTQKKKYKYKIK